jgi:hypothetical protein
MKKLFTSILFALIIFQGVVSAQNNSMVDSISNNIARQTDFGIGFGIDYGGIMGVNVLFCPIKHLGLFAGVGFQFGGIGWNLGARGYFIPKTPKHVVRPFVKAMYGVNAATVVLGSSDYRANYTGTTVGAGIELRFGRKKSHGLNIELNLPFRSDEYHDTVQAMKNDPMVENFTEASPVTISIGYHWEF